MKPGYKQTEVGVIPEDWDVASLGELNPFITSGSRGWAEFYADHGDLFVRITNMSRDSIYLDLTDTKFVCIPPDSTEGVRTQLQNNDVLISITADIGISSYVDSSTPSPAYINQHIALVRFKPTQADGKFVSYFLAASAAQRNFRAKTDNGAKAGMSLSGVANIQTALPPLPEQTAIAQALSDVDTLLATLDQMIAKKRDLKQAAMQQLLTGKTRLPGFSREWEVKTLFELAEGKKELFDDGDWIESEHITTQGVRLVQTGNIGSGCFVEKAEKKYIYETSFNSLRCKQLRTGDLLVCRLADPAGRACVFPDIGEAKVVTSVDVTICRPPRDSVDRVYLANVFSTPEWFRKVSDRSGGTTHKRISRGALGRIPFDLPPLPEQTAIATILSDMDAELSALETRRDKTRNIKQAMMQELLTGRTRLVQGGLNG